MRASELGENVITRLYEKWGIFRGKPWCAMNSWQGMQCGNQILVDCSSENVSRIGDVLELIFMGSILIRALIMLIFYWDLLFVKCFETHENAIL